METVKKSNLIYKFKNHCSMACMVIVWISLSKQDKTVSKNALFDPTKVI